MYQTHIPSLSFSFLNALKLPTPFDDQIVDNNKYFCYYTDRVCGKPARSCKDFISHIKIIYSLSKRVYCLKRLRTHYKDSKLNKR